MSLCVLSVFLLCVHACTTWARYNDRSLTCITSIDRELEHERIGSRGEVIYGNGQHQNTFGDGPDESTPLDIIIVCPSREIDLPDRQLRHDIIGSGLYTIPGVKVLKLWDHETLTWQLPAANVIQAVEDHQATTKPKNLA